MKKSWLYAATWAVVWAAGAAAVGCGGPAPKQYETMVVTDLNRRPVTVQVTSDHPQDVTVYLIDAGIRYRLGMLTTAQTQRFQLPAGVSLTGRDLKVLVHPIGGGGDYMTENFMVNPGDEIRLSIRPALPQTSLSIRAR